MSGPFVGRRTELRSLRDLALSAATGRPGAAVVLGEAGSGKTRLVDEACSKLDSHALLELDLRPEPLESGSALRFLIGEILADPWLSNLPAARALDSTMSQAPTTRDILRTPQISTSVLRVVRAAAARRLTVLRLEDIHWGHDAATRQLLDELGTTIRAAGSGEVTMRLLVVVTARPIQLSTGLAESVGRLTSASSAGVRVELGPLEELDVDRMVRSEHGGRPSGPMIQEVIDATRGLPLLVEEAARMLESEGGLGDVDFLALLPQSAAELAASRLKALTEPQRDILRTAALMRRHSPPVVAEAAEVGVDDVIAALDKACQVNAMQATPTGTAFSHPTVVEALLKSVSTEHRRMIHCRLATALNHRDAPASEQAWHLLEAGAWAPRTVTTIDVLDFASREAISMGDHRLAARFAEAALDLSDDSIPHKRVEWHTLAALAHFRDRSPESCESHASAGLGLARQLDDDHAVASLFAVSDRLALTTGLGMENFTEVEEFLAAAPAIDETQHTQLLEDLSELATLSGQVELGEKRALEAMGHAGKSESPEAQSVAAFALGLNYWTQMRLRDAEQEFERSRRFADQSNDPWFRCWGRGRVPIVQLMRGNAVLAASTAAHAEEVAIDVGDDSEQALALGVRIIAAVARGLFAEADDLGEHARDLLRRTEYSWAVTGILRPLAVRHAVTGGLAAAFQDLDTWESLHGSVPPSSRGYLELLSGARVSGTRSDRRWRVPVSPLTLSHTIWSAEIVPESAHVRIDGLRRALDTVLELGVLMAPDSPQLVPRVAARLARLSGDLDESLLHASHALEVAERGDLQVELALGALERAEIARQFDLGDAESQLELASDIAGRLGMAPVADRVERLAADMGHRVVSRRPVGERRALLFTDIVGSTPLNQALGDEEWLALLAAHDRALYDCVDGTTGHVFAHTGDGVGAWFSRPRHAVLCASDMHDAITRVAQEFDVDLAVRIGVVLGSVIERGTILTGLDLSRANRVMSEADARETIVDEETAEAAEPEFRFRPLGPRTLKGFDESHRLFLAIGDAEAGATPG